MAIVNVTASGAFSAGSRADARVSPVNVTASSAFKATSLVAALSVRAIHVTASSAFTAASLASAAPARILSVTAGSAFTASSASASVGNRTYLVSASSAFTATSSGSTGAARQVALTAGSAFTGTTFASANPIRTVTLTAGSAFRAATSASTVKTRTVTAGSAFTATTSADESRQATLTASSAFTATTSIVKTRFVTVTAASAFTGTSVLGASPFRQVTAGSAFTATTVAHASVGFHTAGSAFTATTTASAYVVLPDGTTSPGGDNNAGLQLVLAEGLSCSFPFTFAELPTGKVLIANGVDPMVRWDAVSGRSVPAGVTPPSANVAVGGTGVGTITGERVAYLRYLDAEGNPSNLSPVSNLVNLGFECLLDGITCDPSTAAVNVWSASHGLTGTTAVVFRGIQGLEGLNGTHTVTAVDADNLSVSTFKATSNNWRQGGSFVFGVLNVVYSGLPPVTDGRVTRRQILRNAEGNLDALYVDVDTTDLTSSAFSSNAGDEALAAGESVPLTGKDGLPFANRFRTPPSHKAVAVAHSGRVFASVDVVYSQGCVAPAPGSALLQGYGTAWPASLVGRSVYVSGCPVAPTVLAVDTVNQVLTLDQKIPRADLPFATYAVRPAPAERKLVYYSEAGSCEAWPEWNAVGVPDDGDTVTGLFTSGSYLYVVERRHVYRLVFSDVPAETAQSYLACRRGAVNNRCVVRCEDRVFMLDEAGIHSYDNDQKSQHVSAAVQTLFSGEGDGLHVDWTADQTLWHGALDPTRETVRWFVTMEGYTGISHAVCYHHRTDRWWVEQYPVEVTSSATVTLNHRRTLAGTECRRVIGLWEGTLDGVPDSGTLRGTATSATPTTLTDSGASFADNLAGTAVVIVEGTGQGQQAVVSSNTSNTITTVQTWATTPDATSKYQVGGVPWSWQSGWFEISGQQDGNTRDVEAVYQPLVNDCSMFLQLFDDHKAAPNHWGYSATNDGVTTTEGSPLVKMDLTSRTSGSRPGYSAFRYEGHQDDRALGSGLRSVHLSGVQGSEQVRLYHLLLNGLHKTGSEDPGAQT